MVAEQEALVGGLNLGYVILKQENYDYYPTICSSGAQHDADLPHEFSDAVEVCLVLVVGVVVQFEGLAAAAGHGLVRGAQLQRLLGLARRVDGSSLPGAACRKYSLEISTNILLIGIPWSHNQQFSSIMDSLSKL